MSVDHRMNTIIYYRIDYKVLLVLLVFMYRLVVKYHCIMCMCSVIQNSFLFLCTGTSTFKVKPHKLILYKKVKGTFFLGTLNAS